MQVILPKEKKIVINQPKEITIKTLTIERLIDNPNQKFVKVFIIELPDLLTLWEGVEYDNIGQWTDEDVEKRIIQIL